MAIVGRVGGAAGRTNQGLAAARGGRRATLEVELLIVVATLGASGACGQGIDPASTGRAELLVDDRRAAVVAYMSCHPGRYCATAMIYAAIREAEPWTPFSVIAGILMLAAICYFVWREMQKP